MGHQQQGADAMGLCRESQSATGSEISILQFGDDQWCSTGTQAFLQAPEGFIRATGGNEQAGSRTGAMSQSA